MRDRAQARVRARHLPLNAGSWHCPSDARVVQPGLPGDETGAMDERLTEVEQLKKVELLAHNVVERAFEEGWLSYLPDDDDQTPLRRSINELARNLRHVHDDGDGCLERRVGAVGGGAYPSGWPTRRSRNAPSPDFPLP